MPDTTIIYLTDNNLEPTLARRVREVILAGCGDTPIVSVSQRPLAFGHNICVGEIGRSWLSIHKQLQAGLECAVTPFVTICEHDVFYVPEHLTWTPPTITEFWNNVNCWLVWWGDTHPELHGLYSYWPNREAMSQTIACRELFLKYTKEQVRLLTDEIDDPMLRKARKYAQQDRNVYLKHYLAQHLTPVATQRFRTDLPNLDVRHTHNFTGPKRGRLKGRCYNLAPWGRFSELLLTSSSDPTTLRMGGSEVQYA